MQPILAVVASGTSLGSSLRHAGYRTTVRLQVALSQRGKGGGPKLGAKPGVYAMYGYLKARKTLTVPAAYQAGTGGVTFGGVLPALINRIAVLKFDSWLTIGFTKADGKNKLSTLENDDKKAGFAAWGKSSSQALSVTDGSLFTQPNHGCTASVCTLAQLTLRSPSELTATLNLRGTTGLSNSAHWDTTVVYGPKTLCSAGKTSGAPSLSSRQLALPRDHTAQSPRPAISPR